MKVLQVVGYKNTGKTTLIKRLLELLKDEDKKVRVIKHHHVDFYLEDTDTDMFLEYTDDVILNTPNFSYHYKRQVPSLEDQVTEAEQLGYDFVLIEGYKRKDYPKIVLTNDEELPNLTHVLKAFKCYIEEDDAVAWFKEWSG